MRLYLKLILGFAFLTWLTVTTANNVVKVRSTPVSARNDKMQKHSRQAACPTEEQTITHIIFLLRFAILLPFLSVCSKFGAAFIKEVESNYVHVSAAVRQSFYRSILFPFHTFQ